VLDPNGIIAPGRYSATTLRPLERDGDRRLASGTVDDAAP